MRKLLFFLLFFLPVSASLFAIPPQDLAAFEKANQEYRQSHFKEAVDLYRSLSEKYPDSAVFLYNLANSLHRQGALGPAILAYEKALLRDPRNLDIRHNLNYVRGLLEYRVEDKRSWYLQAAERFLEFFTEKELFFAVFFFYFLVTAGWAFALFFQQGAPWGWRRKTASLFLALALILVMAKNIQANFIRDAIVMSPGVQVRYGPSESDQVAFKLGEGIKIYILDRGENWSRILIVNGNSGWVKNSDIEQVR